VQAACAKLSDGEETHIYIRMTTISLMDIIKNLIGLASVTPSPSGEGSPPKAGG